MSLSIKYETLEEADRRLRGTVVLYDDAPVYISSVEAAPRESKDEIFRVYAVPLPRDPTRDIHDSSYRKFISSGKFDFAPFKMGFMNSKHGSFFLQRLPVRQGYKQGLANGSLTLERIGPPDKRAYTPAFADLLADPAFADMILNKYPDFKQVMETLRAKVKPCEAATRCFAVSHEPDIDLSIAYHKTKRVGIITDDNRLRLSKQFHFLKEEMEENRIPLA